MQYNAQSDGRVYTFYQRMPSRGTIIRTIVKSPLLCDRQRCEVRINLNAIWGVDNHLVHGWPVQLLRESTIMSLIGVIIVDSRRSCTGQWFCAWTKGCPRPIPCRQRVAYGSNMRMQRTS
jgi:hypothetical protein